MTKKSRARLDREAGKRAADFRAGVDAAKHTITLVIMRTYFVRGFVAGVLVTVVASAVGFVVALEVGALVLP